MTRLCQWMYFDGMLNTATINGVQTLALAGVGVHSNPARYQSPLICSNENRRDDNR